MSPELHEEDIELTALDIFESMGWAWICFEEKFGENTPLGRDSRGQASLPKKLRAALAPLNPNIPSTKRLKSSLATGRAPISLVGANRETLFDDAQRVQHETA